MKEQLKSPASYKRVDAQTHPETISKAKFEELSPVPYFGAARDAIAIEWIDITYDAQNSFGAPLRDTFTCAVQKNADLESALSLARTVRTGRELKGEQIGSKVPCCL